MSHSNPTAGVHRAFLGLLALLALGFSATSALAQSTADIYFIHPDHLNTPRVITNNVNQVVWRWDNLDPFGANLPNENPSGLGNFTCNLRLPGQYFDRETKLHYNYFRDYDAGVGRYVESDPFGIKGGVNLYAYVGGNPLGLADKLGLLPDEPFSDPITIGRWPSRAPDLDQLRRGLENALKKSGICRRDNETCSDYFQKVYRMCAGFAGNAALCKLYADELATNCIVDKQSVSCPTVTACAR
jgi:RHS repeat-associated protein